MAGKALWESEVGPSPWRTLIAYEAWALQPASCGVAVSWPADADARIPWGDDEPQHFGLHSEGPAVVLFMAGRGLLLGAPEGVGKVLRGDPEARVRNVVLLGWDDQHTAGLKELCDIASADRPLTIWTSEWIWEHLLQHCPDRAIEQAQRLLHPGITPADQQAAAGTTGHLAHITFEERHLARFAPQIELLLHYDVGPCRDGPALIAQFRLFNHCLSVRRDAGSAQAGEGWWLLPSPDDYAEQVLRPIYERHPQSRELLADAIAARLRELADLRLDVEQDSATARAPSARPGRAAEPRFVTVRPDREFRLGLSDGELAEWGLADPPGLAALRPALISTPGPLVEEEVELKRAAAAAPPREAAADGDVCLVIGCGGLSTRSGGQIHPCRPVTLKVSDADATYVLSTSLLGFKVLPWLVGLGAQKERAFQPVLFLGVSPATEEAVREEMARLLSQYRGSRLRERIEGQPADDASDLPELTVVYLRGKVMPRRDLGNLKADRCRWGEEGSFPDVGFQYNPAGHLGVGLSLMEAVAQTDACEGIFGETSADRERLFYYTNYNNLGNNTTEYAADLVGVVRKQRPDKELCFEAVAGHPGPGSYWVTAVPQWRTHRTRLMKGQYLSEPARDAFAGLARDQRVLMSTGSFLLRVAPGRAESLAQDIDRLRYYRTDKDPLANPHGIAGVRLDPGGRQCQLERDLDQMTHVLPAAVLDVGEGDGRSNRFRPVKVESDFRATQREQLARVHRELIRQVGTPAGTDSDGPGADPDVGTELDRAGERPCQPPRLLRPVEQHDPWGGYRIRELKGLRASDDPVSETWEASLHWQGTSAVLRSALDERPLAELPLPRELQPDVMVMLLDVHGWLSLQLHPSEWVSRIVMELVRSRPDHPLRSHLDRLPDEHGKEEVFLVLSSPSGPAPAPYYLGFDLRVVDRFFTPAGVGADVTRPPPLPPGASADEVAEAYRQFCARLLAQQDGAGLPLLGFERLLGQPPGAAGPQLPAAIQQLEEGYGEALKMALTSLLPFALQFRRDWRCPTSERVVRGMLLILMWWSLLEAAGQADRDSRRLLEVGFASKTDAAAQPFGFRTPFRFFRQVKSMPPGAVVRVRPGVVHAAGPRLYMMEASNQSDNTLRILDHGREYSAFARSTHHLLACLALTEESFLDSGLAGQFVYLPRDKDGSEEAAGDVRLPVGNVQIESDRVLRPDQQHHLADGDGGPRVVLCERGAVRVRQRTSSMTGHVVVPAAHTAIVWPTPDAPVECRPVGYNEARVVIVRGRSRTLQPQLCLSFTSSGCDLVYHEDPAPPLQASVAWKDAPSDWGGRLEELKKAITELRCIAKKERRGPASHHLPPRAFVSWSGYIKGKDSDPRITSEMLGTGADQDGIAMVKELCADCDSVDFCFDAEAGMYAELYDWEGRLRDQQGRPRSGLVLHAAGGVCLAVCDGVGERQPAEIDRLEMRRLRHLGRMMRWHPSEGWFLDTDWEPGPTAPDGSLSDKVRASTRLSHLLSSRALVVRLIAWAQRCAEDEFWDYIKGLCCPPGPTTTHLRQLWDVAATEPLGRLLADHEGRELLGGKPLTLVDAFVPSLFAGAALVASGQAGMLDRTVKAARKFIETIASEYASAVAFLLAELPQLAGGNLADTVLLSGPVGTHFGCTSDGGVDLLLPRLTPALRSQLRNAAPPGPAGDKLRDLADRITVERSRIWRSPLWLLTVASRMPRTGQRRGTDHGGST